MVQFSVNPYFHFSNVRVIGLCQSEHLGTDVACRYTIDVIGSNTSCAANIAPDNKPITIEIKFERICQEARENGIKDTFLRKKEGYTGKAIIQIDQTGQNSIVLFGGANRQWTLEYVDEVLEHFQAEDILILQNEINVTAEIITKAWEKGMKIVLNPSPFEEKILNWPLEKVSLFLLNEVEGGQMTGEKEPEKILKRLQAKYPNADFVLTYGEKGAWYVGNGETVYCPAKKVKVIDTTAAGDTFTGYFLSARGRGYGVEESLKKATAAAGEAVTRKGAAVSIPCWKELEEK